MMKKNLFIIIIAILIINSCFFCRDSNFPNDNFYNDLASENNRIWGDLLLDVFEDDLDSLTYDYYIKYLEENRMFSAKDLCENIKKANQYFFDSNQENFVILLLYSKQNIIVGDIASTTKLDTLVTWPEDSMPPSFNLIVSQLTY